MKEKTLFSEKSVRFRKFERKPYAIFNSLKKVVSIAVLSASCLTFAHTSNVLAQTSNMTSIEHNLREVEVIGEESSVQLGRVSAPVFIIGKDDIAVSAAQTIQELLEFISSVDVRQRGVNGVQADISIRGSSADQVLILLNGVNLTDPQTGHYNLNLPIDLSSVSRIEVLQGSGSRVLGTASFGGVINIITGEATQNEVNAEVAAGDHGYTSQMLNGSLVVKSSSSFLSVSRQRSEGYISNTDFDIVNTYLHSTYNSPKAGHFSLQFGYQDKGHGANSFYSFDYPNQYEKMRTFFSALSWNKKIGNNLRLSAHGYWREMHDRFELFRNFENAAAFYKGHNYHQTDIAGGQIKVDKLYRVGKTTIGVDARNEHIYSTVLGEAINKPHKVPFEKDKYFTHEKNRLLLTAFVNQVFYFDKFTIAGGALVNHSNDYDFNFSGGIDLDYQINSNLKIYASANHAYRLPTFTDIYYTSATHISNPDIKPEKATVVEGGLKYARNGLRINATVFYRMANDVIDWVKMPDSTKYESRNHTDINALGCDVSAQYIFNKLFVKKITLSYAYMTQDKSSGEYDSKYALDYLKHKIAAGIDHKIYKNISMNWNFVWQDRNGDYTDFITDAKTEYKPFFTTDVRLQWATKHINVYVDANNIFDKKYADFGGMPQAGRWIRTGIKVKLN